MTNTPTPLVLPNSGDTIVFSDRRFVGLGLIKTGTPYRIKRLRNDKLRFIWTGNRALDWPASDMRGTRWEVVLA